MRDNANGLSLTRAAALKAKLLKNTEKILKFFTDYQ